MKVIGLASGSYTAKIPNVDSLEQSPSGAMALVDLFPMIQD
jgi:hypothetical protein